MVGASLDEELAALLSVTSRNILCLSIINISIISNKQHNFHKTCPFKIIKVTANT